MRFEQLSLNEGLSQSNVLSILQDDKGLMWFGTENGLNRYDGYEFLQYRRERGNPNALQNDFEWWADHQDEMNERFNNWLAQ